MFPVLEPRAIKRLRRFGSEVTYPAGTMIVTAGNLSPGVVVVQSGKVEISQGATIDHRQVIVTHQAGQFMGELAQLSNRPSLVDAEAIEDVEAFVVTPDRLRDVLVREAFWATA